MKKPTPRKPSFDPKRKKRTDKTLGRKPSDLTPVEITKSLKINDPIRLNKYIANSGMCSRREADKMIEAGVVSVNGKVITELGYKVLPTDEVKFGDARIKPEKMQYVLLNKPKDYITTMDDPQGRKTVMELVYKACKERIFPVGRLDRATTGLLLLTNDGDLSKKLTHPSYNVRKLYHVETTGKVKPEHIEALRTGIQLEDGFIKADKADYVNGNAFEVGVEIHSGRNRIVRRMFEHLGYEIKKLDRVMFAGLTKKDLPRGRHRFLTPQEIAFLKMIGKH
jgi:23S rRNA pseudouridine2605 synthase